jgi:hypothetical protein
MGMPISPIPEQIYTFQVLPDLIIKNPLGLNSILKQEARDLVAIGATTKKLHQLTKDRLTGLKQKYEENKKEFEKYKIDNSGISPILHLVLANNDMNRFMVLLRNDANINKQNELGDTVLHLAKKMKRDAFKTVIVQHPQLDQTITNKKGKLASEIP